MCWWIDWWLLVFILLNFGPQHPATHGVSRSIAILYGEIIQWIGPEIGLLHRGTEKLINLHYSNSPIFYFDRLDYVSTITQELLFVHALERLISCYGSIHDSTLRTLFLEFYRIPNHPSATTTHFHPKIKYALFLNSINNEPLTFYYWFVYCFYYFPYFTLFGLSRYD